MFLLKYNQLYRNQFNSMIIVNAQHGEIGIKLEANSPQPTSTANIFQIFEQEFIQITILNIICNNYTLLHFCIYYFVKIRQTLKNIRDLIHYHIADTKLFGRHYAAIK